MHHYRSYGRGAFHLPQPPNPPPPQKNTPPATLFFPAPAPPPPPPPAHDAPLVSPPLPRQRAAGSSTVRRRCPGASPPGDAAHPRYGVKACCGRVRDGRPVAQAFLAATLSLGRDAQSNPVSTGSHSAGKGPQDRSNRDRKQGEAAG